MNITLLHRVCKVETRKAYEQFKNQIINNIFDVNDDYIAICVNDLRTNIGRGTAGKFYSNSNNKEAFSSIQFKTMFDIIHSYCDIAENCAHNFAKKFYGNKGLF